MPMLKFVGLFALIPMTTLLVLSFFVLFAASKTEGKGLKSFGKFVAVLLWICATIFFVAGTVNLATGGAPIRHMMMMKQAMMQGCTIDKDGKMECPMMKPAGQTAAPKK